MAESEEHPDRVPSTATGRKSHRRRARSRRAGESAGALSDGSLEQRFTKWMSVIIGITLLFGQLVLTRIAMPTQMVRAILVVLGIFLLALAIVWLDQQRSKKRNPKPRWMRGILIAGFLCISVVLGTLIVLNMSANPIEDGSFDPAEGGTTFSTRSHFEAKTMQLKVLVFHILATVGGMALLAHAIVREGKHRRSESGRISSSVPSTPS